MRNYSQSTIDANNDKLDKIMAIKKLTESYVLELYKLADDFDLNILAKDIKDSCVGIIDCVDDLVSASLNSIESFADDTGVELHVTRQSRLKLALRAQRHEFNIRDYECLQMGLSERLLEMRFRKSMEVRSEA